MDFQTPVSDLPFIGPVYVRRLSRLDIKTLADLLYHFPHRYEDFRIISKIRLVQPGEIVTLRGKVLSIKNEYTKRRMVMQLGEVEDDTGKIGVVWFNQRYLPRTIKVGETLSLSGKIDWFGRKIVMQSPDYEKVESGKGRVDSLLHTGRLVPIYPETASISSKWLRNRIGHLLPVAEIEDFLPNEILKDYGLLDLETALHSIHFPRTPEESQKARDRLAFEELLLTHLSVLERKKEWVSKKVCWKIKLPQKEISDFISSLPFKLTRAQNIATRELVGDLNKDEPMNRLLEGDVGSGKTVVAALCAFAVAKNNLQTAVMAPTQILASQHHNTLKTLLQPYGVTVQLVTSERSAGVKLFHPKGFDRESFDPELKTEGLSRIGGRLDVIVGTHALLHTRAQSLLKKLALVIIDEQHKFGVEQRATLLGQNTECFPHVLTMTATPIPRTVALTLYGDLNLSILDEMPPGRQKITTWLVPPQKREGAYKWIGDQIKSGSQAFIVCPLIEESEIETMKEVKAAKAEFNRLSKEVFFNLKLGLLHGRMKGKEKEEVIDKFRSGKIDILVSTPVVEVGIDIPNATIMMVEAADRFGLAQLHQLRGRVGRGNKKSYCLLFTESPSQKIWGRLRAMEEAKTGPELAELDLRLRGPGELFGTKQHGFPELKVASFSDLPLIHKTRDVAEMIFLKLDQYPTLISHLKTHLVVPN